MKDIETSKKILEEAGYVVIKPTERQVKDCDECTQMYERNEEKECIACSCSCCLFQ